MNWPQSWTKVALTVTLGANALLVGCAPTLHQMPISQEATRIEAEKQREIAFETWMRRQDRLSAIDWRISRAAVDLCPKTRHSIGVYLHDASSYGAEYRPVAIRKFGLGDDVVIRTIVSGSPAEDAGLAPGDVLVKINGKHVRGRRMAEIVRVLREQASEADSLTITAERNGAEIEVRSGVWRLCDYPAVVSDQDAVNAFADGSRVVIAAGMMRFTENDDELALVVGHEIAHNALGHLSKKQGNAILGAIIDAAVQAGTGVNTGGAFSSAAAQTFSQEFESEADYCGLYMAARAGFRIDESANFWRRMAAEHPSSIKKNFSASHPSTPERFLRLEAAAQEIEKKRTSGEALVPEKAGNRRE